MATAPDRGARGTLGAVRKLERAPVDVDRIRAPAVPGMHKLARSTSAGGDVATGAESAGRRRPESARPEGPRSRARPPTHPSEIRKKESTQKVWCPSRLPATLLVQMEPITLDLNISILFTYGEPLVLIWTLRAGRMAILSLKGISAYELG